MRVVCAALFLLLVVLGPCAESRLAENGPGASKDPYKILGVSRQASQQDIRKAYKKAAVEWHPDKSNNPEAETKFVEIKQAYELLSDPERRRVYDQHGITSEDASMLREGHDYSHYGRYAPDPFEEFFGGGGGGGQRFHFDQDISLFHKLSITTRYFETTLLPRSEQTPHLIMFYSDWCFSCMKAAPSFKKLIDTLEPVGTVFATVNAGHENGLVRRLGVHSLPCIVLILDGRTYVYKESVFSIPRIVEFLRQKLPYKLIPTIRDSTVDNFLNGWTDNRVRALLFEPRTQPRLRYLLSAFQFRHRVAFGFVELNSDQSKQIKGRYQINPTMDSLLLFNEDAERAVASVTMSEIPLPTLTNVIGTNQYLALPRLSSQAMLDGVCPSEWNRPRKKLCVILIADSTSAAYDAARDALRRIALESQFTKERVRFAYLLREKQTDFVNALEAKSRKADEESSGDGENDDLVVIWRRDPTHIKFEWVVDARLNAVNASFNHTKQKVDETIQRLLKASEAMTNEAEVQDLLDEHAQGTFSKILTKVLIAVEYLGDNLGEEHVWPAISVVATVAFILGVGYLMSYLVKMEEEAIKKKQKMGGGGAAGDAGTSGGEGGAAATAGGGKAANYVPELKLHELRAEKYNGLVRLLKPGCRTIILVTDMQSRNKLIPAFHKAVWPYRKNKTLMFGYMMIERGLSWYTDMLRISLSDAPDLQINPRNCIGTVIALNGHRKYFCMYHAKHPESHRGAKRMMKMQRHLSSNLGGGASGSGDPEAGSFLPYDDDSDCSDVSEPAILLEENLLDGLSNWLDRLFEGTTHRYYINYWPDFTTK